MTILFQAKFLFVVFVFISIGVKANENYESKVIELFCTFDRVAYVKEPPWDRGITSTGEYIENASRIFYLDYEQKWLADFYPPLFKPDLKYEFKIEGDLITATSNNKDGLLFGQRKATKEDIKNKYYFEKIVRLNKFDGIIKVQRHHYVRTTLKYGKCDKKKNSE